MTFFQDSHTTVYQGDAREVLKSLPERSVQCVVTSPPYWGLRDYGLTCEHRKAPSNLAHAGDVGPRNAEGNAFRNSSRYVDQPAFTPCDCPPPLGLEPTPALYVEHVVEVFRSVRRVLRDDGTCWINMGDGYADKQLQGIPWMVAFALRADGWWLRSDIVWSKPNPMPESVRDRPTHSHEYVFLLSKRGRYYYDADAIREPHDSPGDPRKLAQALGQEPSTKHGTISAARPEKDGWARPSFPMARLEYNPAGRNKRSVWEIATQPYPDAHFATFPEALVRPCILAGTSERGCCGECGAPWERVTERESLNPWAERRQKGADSGSLERGHNESHGAGMSHDLGQTSRTVGWRPTCKHEAETQPCTVLDMFAGSGTTALVARKAGRKAILIELSEEYCRLIVDRIGQGVLL